MADDEDKEQKPKGSALTKILLFAILPLFIISGTLGGLYFSGVIGGGDSASEEELSEQEGEGEEDAVVGPATYIKIDPAFVVNFVNTDKAKFLQITLEVMTRQPEMSTVVESHMPIIRNNLVLLFGSQTYDELSTLEGKEALRESALQTVQDILEEETGDPIVEAVYFTSLVMQ